MELPHLFATPSSTFTTRRDFLRRAGSGCGLLALAGLLRDQRLLAADGVPVNTALASVGSALPTTHSAVNSLNPLAAHPGHFVSKAKSVIWIFLNGGPSHIDTWDYKPELAKRDGKPLPGFDNDTGFFPKEVGPLMKSPFSFAQYGDSGAWVSDIFPEQAKHVDRMAFLHSCFTQTNNHSPALFEINTGQSRMGYPCIGAGSRTDWERKIRICLPSS